jgi:DNA (cytosine-5)-methyltransferase 1
VGISIEGIDLFCGAGGLTRGLLDAGIKMKLGVDIDPACEYPYTVNNKVSFLLKSVRHIGICDLKNVYDENHVKLLAGCAPCQPFSSLNLCKKNYTPKANRNLLLAFLKAVELVKPDLIAMENVPLLARSDIFRYFISDLQKMKYFTNYKIINCVDFGVAQGRKRLIFFASKFGKVGFVRFKGERKTVRSVIGALPPIEGGIPDGDDLLHVAQKLSALNTKRIMASKPGGTWKDWPSELVLPSRKNPKITFHTSYGRLRWDEPAPTLTCKFNNYGSGRNGHPEQNRALSLREGALLQGFPPGYAFAPPEKNFRKSTVARLIGNAVPVNVGRMIGVVLRRHLKQVQLMAN